MNTSVNIGSSQDFRLSRVLLVYGTSSYQGFPYRHPFVTLHEVIHDSEGARLLAAQPQLQIEHANVQRYLVAVRPLFRCRAAPTLRLLLEPSPPLDCRLAGLFQDTTGRRVF